MVYLELARKFAYGLVVNKSPRENTFNHLWQASFNKLQLRRGDICAANFIPPANGTSLGCYFVKNWLFKAKWGQSKQLWHPNLQTFFAKIIIFGLVGDEVKTFRKTLSSQTDRQTNSGVYFMNCFCALRPCAQLLRQ